MIPAAQLAAGILSTSAAAWARLVASLLLYAVAARVLGAEPLGVFALGAAILLLVEYGVFDSVSEAVVQRAELAPGHLGAALLVAGGAGLAVLGAVAGLAGPIARGFGVPQLAAPLPWMAAGVALVCLSSAHAGLLRRQARFHTLSGIAALAAVLGCGTGAALLLLGWGVGALVAYFLVEKAVLAAGHVLAAAGTHPFARGSRAETLELLRYALPILGQRAAYYLRTQMDRLLIAWLLGPTVLGAYQLAARVADALQAVLLTPTSKLFFVSFARLQDRAGRLRAAFLQGIEAISYLAFPAAAGLALVGPDLVRTLFGPGWGSSETLLRILALAMVPQALGVMAGALVSARGDPRTFLLVETAAALAGLLLLLALAPLGVAWIAAAGVIREGFAVLAYAVVLRRGLALRARAALGAVAPGLAVTAGMAVGALAMQALLPVGMPDPMRLVAVAAAGVLVYAILMLATRRPQVLQMIFLLRQGLSRSPGA